MRLRGFGGVRATQTLIVAMAIALAGCNAVLGLDERGEIEDAASGDVGAEVADAGAEVADAGAEVGDVGAEVADAGAEVGDVGAEVADAGAEVGDVGADVGDAGAEVGDVGADVGDAGADAGDVGADVGDAVVDDAAVDATVADGGDAGSVGGGGGCFPGATACVSGGLQTCQADGTTQTTACPENLCGGTPPACLGVVQVAVGFAHTCALVSDGTVWCWGDNESAQLGDGTYLSRLSPVKVHGLPAGESTVTALAAGHSHTCAIVRPPTTSDAGSTSEVWCWGDNSGGELGNGSTNPSAVPVQALLSGSAPVVQLSAGDTFTCALFADGTVECWGANDDGQVGTGTATTNVLTPTPVQTASGPLTNVLQISAAPRGAFSVAIVAGGFGSTSGTVYTWGHNVEGQLGRGDEGVDDPTPAAVSLPLEATSVAAGFQHACAILTNTTVRCWGWNSNGQLGDGSLASSLTPVALTGLTGVASLSAGSYHTCATLSVGAVACWGENNFGQCGNVDRQNQMEPQVAESVTSAAGQIQTGDRTTCAVTTGGSLQCWGDDSYGELGNGTTTATASPTPIEGVSGAVQVALGGWNVYAPFACAVVNDGAAVEGEVLCWGNNDQGQLGDGTTTSRATPMPVLTASAVPLTGIASVTLGQDFACALSTTGAVSCWGNNLDGQLGSAAGSSQALSVVPLAIAGLPATISSISAGTYFVCALSPGGAPSDAGTTADEVWCWGDNGARELGAGASGPWSATPIEVTGLPTTISTIGTGSTFAFAVDATDGSVLGWGGNSPNGQLGNGTTTTAITPTLVTPPGGGVSLEGVVEVRGGDQFACARLSSGRAVCWGYGASGNLGDGSLTSPAPTPRFVDGVEGATGLFLGSTHACALTTVGTSSAVTCWGSDNYGQRGDGTLDPSITTSMPTIPSFTGVAELASAGSGPDATCARMANGTVDCWGFNEETGTSTPSTVDWP